MAGRPYLRSIGHHPAVKTDRALPDVHTDTNCNPGRVHNRPLGSGSSLDISGKRSQWRVEDCVPSATDDSGADNGADAAEDQAARGCL